MSALKWDLKKRGNRYSLRVYLPPELGRLHPTANGKPKTEKVYALRTSDRTEANRRAVQRLPEVMREIYKLPDPAEFEMKPQLAAGIDPKTGEIIYFEETEAPGLIDEAERIEGVYGLPVAQEWVNRVRGNVNLGNAAEEYRSHMERTGRPANERTRNRRVFHINELVEWWGDPRAGLKAIRVRDVDSYIDHLRSLGNAAATINGKISSLSNLWEWARKRELVPQNIWQGQSVTAEPDRDPRPFTPEEIKTVRAALLEDKKRPEHLDLFTLLLFAGSRIEEVCSLTVSQVTFDEDGEVTGFTAKDGKAGKGVSHWIPVVHPDAKAILKRRCAGNEPADHLFGELRKGPQGWSHYVARTLRYRYRKALGFPTEGKCEVDNHSLRRVHATAGENAGLTEQEIDRLQRRKSGSIAGDVYSSGPTADRKTELQTRVSEYIDQHYWSDQPKTNS